MIDPEKLSYARCAETKLGYALVRVLENAMGRKRMMRMLEGYQEEMASGKSFWQVMWERFGLSWELDGVGYEGVPRDGPLLCVSNHPFGILDGFAICHLLAQARPDFKFLANDWLVPAPEIAHHILPIDRNPTREAMQTNVQTRREALQTLKGGGCVAMFPAGTVSLGARWFRNKAYDSSWKPTAASLIQLTGASVMPVFIHGQNRRMYQIAGHISEPLRWAMSLIEFEDKLQAPVKMTIGEPIPATELAEYYGRPEDMMRFLRSHTYSLSHDFMDELTRGKAWG